MSGTELRTSRNAADATVDARGKRSYTANYQVKMSAASDGPAAVFDFLESRNIVFGSAYSYNGDNDSSAYCNGMTPRRRQDSVEWWDVTVTYGPPEEQEPQTPGGIPSDNPDEWRWQHMSGYATWQEAVWSATNWTSFPHWDAASVEPHAYTRPSGTLGPVVNSANVVLDPPLMQDRFDRVWQVTTFSRAYDSAFSDLVMGAINSDLVKTHTALKAYYGLEQNIYAPYMIKCTNAGATYRTFIRGVLRIPYWEWSWEFRFRTAGDTWLEYVLDRGLTTSPEDGMPTGVVSGNTPGDAVVKGRTPLSPIVDSSGRRVPEMVLLDGAGYPMLPDDKKWTEGFYFGWLKEPTYSFASLPFPFFEDVS